MGFEYLDDGEKYLAERFGLDPASVLLARKALAEAPPMSDAQAREIGAIMGLVPVDLPPSEG